jgi:hypothetical protein
VREVELELLVVGVAVVPGDKIRGRPRSRKVLARDAESPIGLRTHGVDHRVVQRVELLVGDVVPDLDITEEAKARPSSDLLERLRDGLELRVVGGNAEPDEAPRRRQALDHVDLDRRILARQERGGRIKGSRS